MQGVEAVATEVLREDDRQGFREIVEEHSSHMYRLAYRMTGNRDDADDIVQETFLRAYRSWHRFDPRAKPSTWLHRIAANCATDLLRRRGRWKTTEIDTVEVRNPMTSRLPSPERVARGSDVERTVQDTLGRLSANERVAFTLRHYEGLSIREVAGIMDLGENAAKNHIFRAVRKMRKALKPLVGTTP
jgi:RNA polymerase sigma-70 factor (ECF subfamily)